MTPDEARRQFYQEMAAKLAPIREGFTGVMYLEPYGTLGLFLSPEEWTRLAGHFGRLALEMAVVVSAQRMIERHGPSLRKLGE